MRKADFYIRREHLKVQCTLCPHNCRLAEGEFGLCGVRQNKGGILYSHVYERAIATHVDPVEKKPLFHVFPGSKSFSIATVGCNFKCTFCQNHEISQMPRSGRIEGQYLPVAEVIDMAEKYDCKTIACTYTEPTIYFEYAYDIARQASERNIRTVFVSNGFINPKPIRKIAPYLAAANIDLKGWDDTFYRTVCGGELKSVLNALKLMKQLGIFLEVTTLVVTGYVDKESILRDIAKFIANELGVETPWHISRFYPSYKYAQQQPTAVGIIQRAREIGFEEGLRYVYSGNVKGDDGESTFCYSCGEKLISRYGYLIEANKIINSKCPSCGAVIDGIGL
ncbi:AmmeMemoRadiSam system radical SAM enzyme [candidate division KSB1 bacterium]|nr:AmmeMemoRadiSam system radical SAM enzyme [candidate division KSB1 bacterium]RQW03437.1 MAG: AmmeMemoRadiSam system radical SAM enzyme [candidate division KSB1 bacterium]